MQMALSLLTLAPRRARSSERLRAPQADHPAGRAPIASEFKLVAPRRTSSEFEADHHRSPFEELKSPRRRLSSLKLNGLDPAFRNFAAILLNSEV